MKPSHRERLLANTPDDLVPATQRTLEEMSGDGNDPAEALFAAGFEIANRHAKRLEAQVRELQASLDQAREDARRADQKIASGLDALRPTAPWKRVLMIRGIEVVILLTLIFTITPMLMKHYAGESAQEAAKQTAILEKAQAEQSANLAKIANDPAAMVAYVQLTREIAGMTNKTNATLAAIANMLRLPESAIAYNSGNMIVRLSKSDVKYTTDDRNAYLEIRNSIPDLYGAGETVEEKLKATEAAKKKLEGK